MVLAHYSDHRKRMLGWSGAEFTARSRAANCFLLTVRNRHPDLQPERVQANEASRITLIICVGGAPLHGGHVRVVEALRTFAAGRNDVPLVKFEPHSAAHIALGFADERLKRDALGCKPKAVVNESAVARNEAITQMHDLAIHGQRFHLPMREMENGAARRFVNAAAFHPDETIFDNINPADAVLPAERVQRLHDREWPERFTIYRNAIPVLKF